MSGQTPGDVGSANPSRVLLHRVLGNSAWQVGADLSSISLRVIEGFIVAVALGASSLGELALVIAFVATAFQLLDFRVWEVITRYVVEFRSNGEIDRARAMVRICLVLGAATAVLTFGVIWVAAPLAVSLFTTDPAAADHVRFLAIGSLFTGSITTTSALLRVSNDFRVLALKTVAISIVRLCAVAVSVSAAPTVKAVLVPLVLVAVLDGAASALLARRSLHRLGLTGWWKQPLAVLAPVKRQVIRLFITSNANATLKLLQGQGDILVLGWLLPTAAVGHYRLARAIAELARIPVGGIYFACFAEFTRMWVNRQRAELRQFATSLLRLTSGLGVVTGAAIAALAPLLPMVLGSEYEGSVPILRWLALATVLEISCAVLHPFAVAAERARYSLAALACAVTVELTAIAAIAAGSGVSHTGLAHVASGLVWLSIILPAALSADREAARWTPAIASAGDPSP